MYQMGVKPQKKNAHLHSSKCTNLCSQAAMLLFYTLHATLQVEHGRPEQGRCKHSVGNSGRMAYSTPMHAVALDMPHSVSDTCMAQAAQCMQSNISKQIRLQARTQLTTEGTFLLRTMPAATKHKHHMNARKTLRYFQRTPKNRKCFLCVTVRSSSFSSSEPASCTS